MQCKGKILGVSIKAGGGIVALEDGRTFVFHLRAWQQPFAPMKGLPVVIEVGERGLVQQITATRYDYWRLRVWLWLLRRPALVYSN